MLRLRAQARTAHSVSNILGILKVTSNRSPVQHTRHSAITFRSIIHITSVNFHRSARTISNRRLNTYITRFLSRFMRHHHISLHLQPLKSTSQRTLTHHKRAANRSTINLLILLNSTLHLLHLIHHNLRQFRLVNRLQLTLLRILRLYTNLTSRPNRLILTRHLMYNINIISLSRMPMSRRHTRSRSRRTHRRTRTHQTILSKTLQLLTRCKRQTNLRTVILLILHVLLIRLQRRIAEQFIHRRNSSPPRSRTASYQRIQRSASSRRSSSNHLRLKSSTRLVTRRRRRHHNSRIQSRQSSRRLIKRTTLRMHTNHSR